MTQELVGLEVNEVSTVDRGANLRSFLVVEKRRRKNTMPQSNTDLNAAKIQKGKDKVAKTLTEEQRAAFQALAMEQGIEEGALAAGLAAMEGAGESEAEEPAADPEGVEDVEKNEPATPEAPAPVAAPATPEAPAAPSVDIAKAIKEGIAEGIAKGMEEVDKKYGERVEKVEKALDAPKDSNGGGGDPVSVKKSIWEGAFN